MPVKKNGTNCIRKDLFPKCNERETKLDLESLEAADMFEEE